MLSLQKLLQGAVILISINFASAQESWPSPEVAQMYHHALDYLTAGDYEDAIITLKHAISMAPRKMILFRDLGSALYLSGKYSEAVQLLSSINEMPDADPLCYQVAAASQAALGDYKSAKLTTTKGLSRFPSSGLLYHERGEIFRQEKDPEDALDAWLDGIKQDPGYADNYGAAAQIYLGSSQPLWGLIYGEIFVNSSPDTIAVSEMKSALFKGYKIMFDNIEKELPQYGKAEHTGTANNFADAVLEVFTSLTPVVSDGITTENLSMARTRFVMDWYSAYSIKYPFPLFAYWDKLLRTGHFDIYNEWLFGKAESDNEFKAWNAFHPGDVERFEKWKKVHLAPVAGFDSYNNRRVNYIFKNKSKN